MDDPPVLDLNVLDNDLPNVVNDFDPVDGAATFTENGGAVLLAPNAFVRDDGQSVTKAYLRLVGCAPTAQLQLAVPSGPTQTSSAAGWLNLTASSQAELQTWLRTAVTFADPAAEPTGNEACTVEAWVVDGAAKRSPTATAVITVVLVNDNAPQFLVQVQAYSIPEDDPAAVGLLVPHITATDADRGVGADITYSLQTSSPGAIGIDAQTGQLSLLTALDREAHAPSFTVVVVATDSGGRQGLYSAVFQLLDKNDHAPAFAASVPVSVTVPENQANVALVTMVATDPDAGNNGAVTYALQGPAPAEFAINAASGVITALGPFDAESTASYELTVVATDGGASCELPNVAPTTGPCTTAFALTVTVGDINDNPLQASVPTSFVYTEGMGPARPLAALTLADQDSLPLTGATVSLAGAALPAPQPSAVQDAPAACFAASGSAPVRLLQDAALRNGALLAAGNAGIFFDQTQQQYALLTPAAGAHVLQAVQNGSFTWSAWVRQQPNDHGYIFSFQDAANHNLRYFSLYSDTRDNTLTLYYTLPTLNRATVAFRIPPAQTLASTTWQLVTITLDATSVCQEKKIKK